MRSIQLGNSFSRGVFIFVAWHGRLQELMSILCIGSTDNLNGLKCFILSLFCALISHFAVGNFIMWGTA